MLGITSEAPAPVYWSDSGRFSAASHRLWAAIPSRGYAPTIATELVRCVASITHDRFNNGNGNRDLRGPHSTYQKAKFLKKFKDDVRELIDREPSNFPYSRVRFTEACLPILQLRGGAFSHIQEADIVCDGFIALAMVLSGESLKPTDAEELSLIAKITESRNDRAARLVYADWLQDRHLDERAMAVRVHAHLIF